MKLYDFQRHGVDFLWKRARAYLADTMGLGKTIQACVAAWEIGSRNTLVACPASAIENWKREWGLWAPGIDATFVSYASLVRYTPRGIEDYDLVILDEAHYCKTPTAKRTKTAMGVARVSPRSWLLSGTPMPNHPGELYAPIAALWPEIPEALGLKNHSQWFDHFCKWTPTQYGKRVYGVQNGSDLRPWLDKIMLRRKLDDVALDLPPLRVTLHRLPRDTAALNWITGEETSTQRRLLGTYKAPLIAAQILRELDDGAYDKIVIGAYHRDTMSKLNELMRAGGYPPVGFHGGTLLAHRQKAIDAFTNERERRVFIVQQTAGGVSINLQVASEIVLVEPDWVPDVNAQFIKRIHRIGSTEPCRARVFTVAGTQDDGVMRGLVTKIRMKEELGLK